MSDNKWMVPVAYEDGTRGEVDASTLPWTTFNTTTEGGTVVESAYATRRGLLIYLQDRSGRVVTMTAEIFAKIARAYTLNGSTFEEKSPKDDAKITRVHPAA